MRRMTLFSLTYSTTHHTNYYSDFKVNLDDSQLKSRCSSNMDPMRSICLHRIISLVHTTCIKWVLTPAPNPFL